MKHLSIFMTLILCVALQVGAQVSFTVKVPQRVLQGQNFAVTYSLKNGDGSGLRVGDIDGCRRLYGPSTSTRQSYSVTNGQMVSFSSVDYTYTYKAEKTGTFTVPAASIIVDGKQYTTNPTEFTVVDNPNAAAGNNPSNGGAVNIDDIRTQHSDRKVTADDVIVRIILAKNNAWEQEAIDCTIKIYTKYQISSFRPTIQPSFDGFLIEEIPIQSTLNTVETLNGQEYRTATLKRCIIYPQKSGKLTINSGNYELSVVQYEEIPMGFFVTRQPVERDITIKSNTASVEVKELPLPHPSGFSGAVGRFSADTRMVGNSFRTGDPATLLYTVNGTGNIKYLAEPQIDFPSEFEQYTPKTDYDTHVAGGNVSGSMTVEYTFVPQNVGDFHIGIEPFVYFDPSDSQYHTVNLNSFDIKVAKGISTGAAEPERKDIEAKNTDIRHIRTGNLQLSMSHRPVADTVWYWLLYPLALGLLILAVALNIRKVRAARDVTGQKMNRAGKVAGVRLRKAESLMRANDTGAFVEELLKALWGYLSDKLGIPVSRLTRDNIQVEIQNRYGQAGLQAAETVTAIIDECEMLRYAPGSDTDSAKGSLMQQATNAISAIESLKSVKK